MSLNSCVLRVLFSLSCAFLRSSAISFAVAGSLLLSLRRIICRVIGAGGAALVPWFSVAPTTTISPTTAIAAKKNLIVLVDSIASLFLRIDRTRESQKNNAASGTAGSSIPRLILSINWTVNDYRYGLLFSHYGASTINLSFVWLTFFANEFRFLRRRSTLVRIRLSTAIKAGTV